MFEHITSPYHHLHHFRPPIMKSILLAASNEAKAKTSDKSGDIVAQLPLGRHEEGVKEGPRAIPALVMMMVMMMVTTMVMMMVTLMVVVSSLCL